MQRNLFATSLILAALAVMATGLTAVFVADTQHVSLAADARDANIQPPAPEAIEHAQGLAGAFKHASAKIRPSVVSIRSTKVFKQSDRGDLRRPPAPELPEEFRDFFGDDFFDRFGGSPFRFEIPRGDFRQQGQGTGLIFSADGYVITNNHVIEGADEVQVTLVDRRSFDAQVIGTDAKTDIAVLKIEADDLTAATLGDSDAIEVGDWVVAVGSPFGLQHTVTAGIVSAKGRANVGIVEYEDFIQTDAAINPGNSGGPLVNLHGEVVGLNTAIASRSGSFAGVGFSIPSNMVKSIVADILEDGTVRRGWLGVAIQDLTEELAQSFNYDSTNGVLVGQVVPDSPAEKAGLQAGDIIIEYNGRPQRTASGLRNQVARTKPNTQAPLVVVRDGRKVTLRVTIGLLDEKQLARTVEPFRESSPEASSTIEKLGLTVRTLTPELASQLNIDDSVKGVAVTEVQSGSAAQFARLRVGDVILSVNGKPTLTAEDFVALVQDASASGGLRLHVRSEGYQRFVFLKVQ